MDVRTLSNRLEDSPHLRNGLVLTSTGKRDGGGAQVQAVMSSIAFARANGIGFAHTPFVKIAHRRGLKLLWARRWEKFFGLATASSSPTPPYAVSLDDVAAALPAERPLLLRASDCHLALDAEPDLYAPVLPLLRQCYETSGKRHLRIHSLPGTVTIAVHVRRGDILNNSTQRELRYTADERVLATIDCLRAALPAATTSTVNIYSEGDADLFDKFRRREFSLHLDTDVFETFHNLVEADYLVMAKSSLSYVAALLSRNVKLYEPFWHNPMSAWTVRADDGSFDVRSLRSQAQGVEQSGADGLSAPTSSTRSLDQSGGSPVAQPLHALAENLRDPASKP